MREATGDSREGRKDASGRAAAAVPGPRPGLAWHMVCLGLLAVLLYPVVWLVSMSFKPVDEILQSLALLPKRLVFGGVIDTFWPLALPKFLATDAFFVFLIVQFMRGLPDELADAARIDGCGPVRTFAYVVLPLSRPALVTTGIFTFVWTWNDFLSQLIYLSTPEKYTLPLALRLYIDQTSETSYGAMFAMSVLTLLPIGLFFLVFQRMLVQGVTTSGMGGA